MAVLSDNARQDVWADAMRQISDAREPVSISKADPSGNVTELEYGTDVELVKDSTGVYHVDIDADEAGWWHYRFYSTGNGQAASLLGAFDVASSALPE